MSSAQPTATLRPTGALDLAYAPPVAVEAADEVRAGRNLIVDLSGVCFIDSTGVAMLMNALRRATRAGVGFAVICGDGQPRRTIERLRMLETLNVGADEAEALTRMHRLLPARNGKAAPAPGPAVEQGPPDASLPAPNEPEQRTVMNCALAP